MRVNKFIEKLKENYSAVHKLYLTRTTGEYLCDERLVAFSIKNFGKKNESVIEIIGAPMHFPKAQITTKDVLELYEEPAILDHPIEIREKVVIKEVPVEKVIIKEVLIEKIIEKEKIIYVDRVLDWKIKII